ncbi:MAG: hypothetical protein Q8K66_08900 [Sediminibacterium sp.]|nr:hypothetical protein [Sediminibacterium sp.]MDP3127268.1 hypothetical protein [Sediminibacterium sp.]MDP3665665.1 hypothetical protein [Sediminibacterium sp.]
MKGVIIGYFSLFIFHFSSAQPFGGNPPSVKWQQVNTDTVRVIFPKGWDVQAQRIATIIHQLQKQYAHSIGDNIRKINMVLQNQTLFSNAYVGLAPYRSELYLTPLQDAFTLGAVRWTDNLAVHEFRHVQQYSNFNKGLSKVASFILGEQGQAVANAAAIPDWFFEGDAVFNETKLTTQGRGTLPLFMSSYQSLFIANRQFSYMKLRNGSLQNYVPNHYELGYLLVAYGRKKYGEDIWRKVTDDAVRFKPLFYPFQGSVKKNIGIPFDQFVNEAMLFYQSQWKLAANEKTDWLTQTEKNNVISYKYPYLAADGALVVLKSSYKEIPSFYKLHTNGSVEKLAVKDIATDDYYAYKNERIVYAAYEPDARWGNREYQSIKLLDCKTGEGKTIFSHTRFFSPDISSDGEKLATVMTQRDSAFLLLLNVAKGTLIRTVKEADAVYAYPKFSAHDENLYWISRKGNGEMAIKKQAVTGGEIKEIMPYRNRIIGFLQVQGDTVLFTTTYKGRDEVWAIIDGVEPNGPYRLANHSTGIYQAILQSGNTVVGAVFTADGYRLGRFQSKWEKVAISDAPADNTVGGVYQRPDQQMLNNLTAHTYPVSNYSKSFHLLNIHSFRPFYELPEYSLTLYGQNILNTFQSEIAYTYQQNEGSHKIGYQGIFGGSYVQPLFGISQNWQRSGVLSKDTTLHWNELVGHAGLQLPLNFSGGKQYRYLTLSSTYNMEKINWTGLAEKIFSNKNFSFLHTRLSYAQQIQKAKQHIYPHWAQNLLLQYKGILNQYTANQFLTSGSVYLPGFSTNHSLVITAAYQSRDTMQQYLFPNNFPFARGYRAVDFPRMWKIGVNYHLPLAYPDWGFGNLVYFLRIRTNLFFDYTRGKSLRTGVTYPFQTIGTELFFDTRWWNQQPITFGIRYSKLINKEFRGTTQPNVWELVLPVNLFN